MSDKRSVLDALSAAEKAAVLDELLAARPGLRQPAEACAAQVMAGADRSAVAGDVEDALLGLGIEELDTRAGYRPGRGYVHPAEAADEILDEALQPFLDDLYRRAGFGMRSAAVPGPAATTWLEHAVGYARMKWPRLAPHSRASLADALATVTVALTRPTAGRPPTRTLRAALYRHAFNSGRHAAWTDPVPARVLAWLARASLPVAQLSDPGVIRAAMDALTVRLDGGRAAAATVSRKRAVFHDALGYAVELGLLPANPLGQVQWTAPRSATAVNPQTVASPAQVRAILAEVARLRPELTAFFGCLYYAALRPEEAVALRQANLILPAHRRGKLILTESCPRTGSAWTSTGTPHEPRGLKHRPDGAVRAVPIPPVLAGLLRQHLREFGTAPDGRLFRGARGGILSESTYGRVWHAARETALGPELAATPLARRPYDLRHAALSLWLSATSAPAEVAARAGNSIHVLQDVYAHCIDGRGDVISQQIEDALDPASSIPHRSQGVTASGYTHRRYQPDPVRHMSVNYPTGARMAHNHPASHTRPGSPRCFL